MARLEVGDPAPDFSLQADDGSTVTLSELRGRRVVIYFYPKDATKGCTTQACEYRDAAPEFEAAGASVFGISPDPIDSHRRFAEKEGLNFRLLSDPEHEAAERYGVWVQKSMYGRTFMGIERSSFVIAADGTVEQARYKVKSSGDAAGSLAAVRG